MTQTGGEETKNEDDGKDCRYQEPGAFRPSIGIAIVNHGYVSNKVIKVVVFVVHFGCKKNNSYKNYTPLKPKIPA